AVCYDIRFPALFEALGRARCDVIAIPAAFTVPTGQAHWHLLQRARAVEASAYVVAAAQVGKHDDGRRTYGHSLVVDPWGEVVVDMGGRLAELAFTELDRERIADVRRQLPSLANRRPIPKSATTCSFSTFPAKPAIGSKAGSAPPMISNGSRTGASSHARIADRKTLPRRRWRLRSRARATSKPLLRWRRATP